jgi:hypothetical protein
MTFSEGAIRYQVSDLFFYFEDMSFPGSVVFLNACTSMKKPMLSTALLSNGADTVFGWSDTTNSWFVQEAMRELLLAAAIPHSRMEEAYAVVDPMFPGTVRKDADGDDLSYYKLSNGMIYGDEDDAASPVTYRSDFISQGSLKGSLSRRAWSESSSDLYAISPHSGTEDVLVGPIRNNAGQPIDITDVAYSSAERTLYGVSYDQLVRIDTEDCRLEEQSTRTAYRIGDGLGLLYETSALACDSSGNLYGGTVGGDLLRIDRDTGLATIIGPYGQNLVASGDLAFDSIGRLYGSATPAGGSSDVLVVVSTSTGAANEIGPIGYDEVYGLFFIEDSLYGVTEDNELLSIDTATGRGTLIRQLGFAAWGAQDARD